MPDKEIGQGQIIIATSSGTSENGNIPFLYVAKDALIIQMGLDTNEFDESKLSYIYVDGREEAKEQISESQLTINLKEKELKVGKHKIEVVQFDNNKTDGQITTYKTASYECK